MSPTSLANLIDSKIFEEHGVPFDLVIFDEASQIHRVWSTNWWHFEQQEKEGIVAAINAARG